MFAMKLTYLANKITLLIVNLIGGEIKLRSHFGKGGVFTISYKDAPIDLEVKP